MVQAADVSIARVAAILFGSLVAWPRESRTTTAARNCDNDLCAMDDDNDDETFSFR
jgi:hypothetical protein